MMTSGYFKKFSLILRLLDIDFIYLTLREGCLDFSHFSLLSLSAPPLPPPWSYCCRNPNNVSVNDPFTQTQNMIPSYPQI